MVRTGSTQRTNYHFGPKTIRDRFDGYKDSDSSCSGWVSVANSCGYSNEHSVSQQLSVSQECLCFRSVNRPTLNRLRKSTIVFSLKKNYVTQAKDRSQFSYKQKYKSFIPAVPFRHSSASEWTFSSLKPHDRAATESGYSDNLRIVNVKSAY